MKTSFTLRNIKFQGVEIGEVRIDNEYSIGEAVKALNAGKDFIKTLVKELPEFMQDVKKAETANEEIFGKEEEKEVVNIVNSVVANYYRQLDCCITNEQINRVMEKAYADENVDSNGYGLLIEHSYELRKVLIDQL